MVARPSEKSEKVEKVLENILGADRRSMIADNVCMPKPIGCGGPAIEFKDEVSKREYSISGLCQECQDRVFG